MRITRGRSRGAIAACGSVPCSYARTDRESGLPKPCYCEGRGGAEVEPNYGEACLGTPSLRRWHRRSHTGASACVRAATVVARGTAVSCRRSCA